MKHTNTCDKCGKNFNSINGLKYHVKKDVCDEKKYSCKHCGCKFSSASTMYRHIRQYCKSKMDDTNESDDDTSDVDIDKKILLQQV